MQTTYTLCVHDAGFHQGIGPRTHSCGHAHRSLRTAARCNGRIQRATQRVHGSRTWAPIVPVAVENGEERPLTPAETDEFYYEEAD